MNVKLFFFFFSEDQNFQGIQVVTRLKCSTQCKHHNKKLLYLCRDCPRDPLACSECVTSNHHRHNLVQLKDLQAINLQTIDDNISGIHQYNSYKINRLVEHIQEVEKNLGSLGNHYQTMVSDIQQRGDMVQRKIQDITDKFVSTAKCLEKQDRRKMESFKDERKQLLETINDKITETKNINRRTEGLGCIDLKQDVQIIRDLLEREKSIPTEKVPRASNFRYKKWLNANEFELLVGQFLIFPTPDSIKDDLQKVTSDVEIIQQEAAPMKSNLKQKGYFESGPVNQVCPIKGRKAWVLSIFHRALHLIDMKGTILHKLELSNNYVIGISTCKETGHLWFLAEDHSVNEVISCDQSYHILRRFATGLYPQYICVEGPNSIYISFDRQTVPSRGTSHVAKYTYSNVKMSFEPTATTGDTLKDHYLGEIAVSKSAVAILSMSSRGNIFLFDKSLNPLTTYQAYDQVESIACDSIGRLFTCINNSRTLFHLGDDGNVKQEELVLPALPSETGVVGYSFFKNTIWMIFFDRKDQFCQSFSISICEY